MHTLPMALSTDLLHDGNTMVLLVAVILLGGLYVWSRYAPQVEAREPPVLRPTIPFIGHIIGMVREGPHYLRRLRYIPSYGTDGKELTT